MSYQPTLNDLKWYHHSKSLVNRNELFPYVVLQERNYDYYKQRRNPLGIQDETQKQYSKFGLNVAVLTPLWFKLDTNYKYLV